jgi:hexosaminidase
LTVATATLIRAAAFGNSGVQLASPRSFDASVTALLATDSTGLSACNGGTIQIRFGLTPDAPGWSPAYDSNFFDACLVWHDAPLSAARAFTIDVARLLRNLGLPHDFANLKAYYPATRFGELVVRTAGCKEPIAGTFPLPDPATAPNRFSFFGALPERTADGDLCMTFTAPASDPIYAVGAVRLSPR